MNFFDYILALSKYRNIYLIFSIVCVLLGLIIAVYLKMRYPFVYTEEQKVLLKQRSFLDSIIGALTVFSYLFIGMSLCGQTIYDIFEAGLIVLP